MNVAGGQRLAPPGPLEDPAGRQREWRAWYAYDWANSAFLTTVGGVLLGPYVTALAERDACGHSGTAENPCIGSVSLLGLDVAAGSLWLYAVTVSTILAAVLLPLVGALVDRVGRKRVVLAVLAWAGSAATCLMAVTGGTGWHVVVALGIVAATCAAAATVAYNSLLNDIAAPLDRDAVSSRGWAAGYLGAGVLLVVNMAYLQFARSRGMDLEEAVRVCLVTAGLWWGGWTLWPFLRPDQPFAGGSSRPRLRRWQGLAARRRSLGSGGPQRPAPVTTWHRRTTHRSLQVGSRPMIVARWGRPGGHRGT